MTTPTKKRISLRDELATIEQAVDGLRLLSFAYLEEHFGSDADRVRAPQAISALAALIASRLRQVGRVAAGTVDPREILGAHNDATELNVEPGELLLAVWDADEIADRGIEGVKRLESGPGTTTRQTHRRRSSR